ncbi:NeuD/PglB/VioB family sugar acetyltransferase [Halopseudomonas salegens]|nr:NeuD/PglB/VioB family sugar acetyltransferase [Halopseudomonas salegens]
MKTIGVIGAGGFGREVMPLVRKMMNDQEEKDFVFIVEDEYDTGTQTINEYNVIKLSDFLKIKGEKYYCIAIGDSKIRERISTKIPENMATPISVFSETHISLDQNMIGPGAIFSNFTHVTSNAKIGKHFHCNIYSYVAHDVVIGDYVTFGPGVKCNGHVVVEDHVYIGTGAIIKDGTHSPITIGQGAIIGMGAVVTKSVAPGEIVVGNPARPIKKN